MDGNYPHQPHMIETGESKAEERQSVLPVAEEEPSLSINNQKTMAHMANC